MRKSTFTQIRLLCPLVCYVPQASIVSGNGLMPSGNKPLPESMLTKIPQITKTPWSSSTTHRSTLSCCYLHFWCKYFSAWERRFNIVRQHAYEVTSPHACEAMRLSCETTCEQNELTSITMTWELADNNKNGNNYKPLWSGTFDKAKPLIHNVNLHP